MAGMTNKAPYHDILEGPIRQTLELARARAAKQKGYNEASEHAQKAGVCERVIDAALDCVIHATVPFDDVFLVELIIRTTAYMISGLPEVTRAGAMLFLEAALPSAVKRKVESGQNMKAEWDRVH